MHEVTVTTKPFDDDLKLYSRKQFILKPGINSLVGCNGSGKSTFIDCFLYPQLRRENIACYKHNDRTSGHSHYMEKLAFMNDFDGVAQMYMSSEGEQIVFALHSVIRTIVSLCKENKGKKVFIIFDAIDSGMSVDEIIEIRGLFLDLVIPDMKSKFKVDLYVVVAANNYEWCNDERIHNINITNGSELKITSYENYKECILKSGKNKDKMRGYNES